MNEPIPTYTESYRDIKAVVSLWSQGDANNALAQGAVLLGTCTNPDSEDCNDAFCLLIGLPEDITPTPSLRAIFKIGD